MLPLFDRGSIEEEKIDRNRQVTIALIEQKPFPYSINDQQERLCLRSNHLSFVDVKSSIHLQ